MKVIYQRGRVEAEAEVIKDRGNGTVDLLVQGKNEEGESPYRVTCVPSNTYVENFVRSDKRGGEIEDRKTIRRDVANGVWRKP